MNVESEGQIELYVVTCTDLHYARGPIVGLDLAIDVARAMNGADTRCMYVPVPFIPMTEGHLKALAHLDRPDPGANGHPYNPKGYL